MIVQKCLGIICKMLFIIKKNVGQEFVQQVKFWASVKKKTFQGLEIDPRVLRNKRINK